MCFDRNAISKIVDERSRQAHPPLACLQPLRQTLSRAVKSLMLANSCIMPLAPDRAVGPGWVEKAICFADNCLMNIND
jgi:hypothetical protein